MCKSNPSASEGRDQMDITEVIDKMFCLTRLVTNDSGVGVIVRNLVGEYSKYGPFINFSMVKCNAEIKPIYIHNLGLEA